MEILDASSTGVEVDLRSVWPFKSGCITPIQFTPQLNGTHVLWIMDGPQLFVGKDFGNRLVGLREPVEVQWPRRPFGGRSVLVE